MFSRILMSYEIPFGFLIKGGEYRIKSVTENTRGRRGSSMDFIDQRSPRNEGTVTLRFTEMEIRHILLDLESQSKVHRSGTKEFKKIAHEWIGRCGECRREGLE
jgi:hypothetical protein